MRGRGQEPQGLEQQRRWAASLSGASVAMARWRYDEL
nr:MAG TPA: hypothetical protein [Caudoviricetes sp.]